MLNHSEEWRPVAGFKGLYSVSSLGRIRQEAERVHTFPGRILKQRSSATSPYLRVNLSVNAEARRGVYVHHLVAAAFIGIRPDGHHINHIDADKHHNAPSNLEYVTPSGNLQHRYVLSHCYQTASERRALRLAYYRRNREHINCLRRERYARRKVAVA